VVTVTPLDSMRQRVYIAPLGLWLTLDSGMFSSVEIDKKKGRVRIWLSPFTGNVKMARLRIEHPGNVPGIGKFGLKNGSTIERGAHVIGLGNGTTVLDLVEKK